MSDDGNERVVDAANGVGILAVAGNNIDITGTVPRSTAGAERHHHPRRRRHNAQPCRCAQITAGDLGILSVAGGYIDIDNTGGHIISDDTGIVATSIASYVEVDSGEIDSANGSGVIAVAGSGRRDDHHPRQDHRRQRRVRRLRDLDRRQRHRDGQRRHRSAAGGRCGARHRCGQCHRDQQCECRSRHPRPRRRQLRRRRQHPGRATTARSATSVNPAPLVGIATVKLGIGSTTIINDTGASVIAQGPAIAAATFDPGVGENNIDIYNDGLLYGGGDLLTPSSTIIAAADGSVTIDNDVNGEISNDIGIGGSSMAAYAGQTILVQNDGTINGNVFLDAQGADVNGVSLIFNNTSNNSWNFDGTNIFLASDNIELEQFGHDQCRGAVGNLLPVDQWRNHLHEHRHLER